MPVNLPPLSATELLPIAGLRIGVTEAGIKKQGRRDLTLMLLESGASVAGVFTQNRFCAAPVQVCRENLQAKQRIRALLINTGCANAGTGSHKGSRGYEDAQACCAALAKLLHIEPQQVLPFSTGVIMENLPVEKITASLPQAVSQIQLAAQNDSHSNEWFEAAHGIMTTDTQAKGKSVQTRIDGQTITLTGISKGAGMIRPNMATMLGYIGTDANITPEALQTMTQEVADASFNRISVDGDTSTNDSFIVMATCKSAMPQINDASSAAAQIFKSALTQVAQYLAHAIVRDGEGASKFITVTVEGGKTRDECLKAAYAIAHSPLVKTAFFASDPNLGRILAAVGYAGIADLEQNKIDLYLDDVHVATQGGRHPAYQETEGQRVMQHSEITVRVVLGRGAANDTVWTCDLSHDYVTINADYRS